MKKTTIEIKGKGYWEVEYMDGKVGNAFYDMSLNSLCEMLSKIDREVKSITWVEE